MGRWFAEDDMVTGSAVQGTGDSGEGWPWDCLGLIWEAFEALRKSQVCEGGGKKKGVKKAPME